MRLSEETLLQRMYKIHGDSIKLNKPYVGNTKSHNEFICDTGHVWNTSAGSILRGHGCPQCWKSKLSLKQTRTIEQIAEQIYNKHEDRVKIIDTDYKGYTVKHQFVCSKGHAWLATINCILKTKHGCPECSFKTTSLKLAHSKDKIVQSLFKIHGNKVKLTGDYSGNTHSNNEFICDKGHIWKANVNNVVIRKTSCPYCCRSPGFSKMEKKWIKLMKRKVNSNIVTSEQQDIKIKLKGFKKCVIPDGYDPITKTVYEFHGDYWHGNPRLWKKDFKIGSLSMKELNRKTRKREKSLLKAGYRVVYCWESDFKRYLKGRFYFRPLPYTVAKLSKSPYCK